jgi:molybdopterin/thiamine biosynthesis adenylyltransferase
MYPNYEELFSRNYGIFTEDDQNRIERTHVVIIGDSGTGEMLATLLARCGIGKLTIAGNDDYIPSDMNRQIGCFNDTIGTNKVSAIRETVLSINPTINITAYNHLPTEGEIDRMIAPGDIIIPAVDDLAYSILLFRAARAHNIPAVLCVPSGTTGWVSVFVKTSPTIEDVFGIPKLDYPDLVEVMSTREYRCAQYNYVTSGDWRVDWFFEYFTGRRPLALICPIVWMTVSLAALETVKIASGRWDSMEAPRCWYFKKGKVYASRFSSFVWIHRRIGWLIFGSKRGTRLHKLSHFVWSRFFDYLKRRESSRHARI